MRDWHGNISDPSSSGIGSSSGPTSSGISNSSDHTSTETSDFDADLNFSERKFFSLVFLFISYMYDCAIYGCDHNLLLYYSVWHSSLKLSWHGKV